MKWYQEQSDRREKEQFWTLVLLDILGALFLGARRLSARAKNMVDYFALNRELNADSVSVSLEQETSAKDGTHESELNDKSDGKSESQDSSYPHTISLIPQEELEKALA